MKLLFLMYCFALSTLSVYSESSIGRLRNTLLKNYNVNLRPVLNESETTKVKFAYYVKHILQLDEKTETLTVEGIIKVHWKDEHLTWLPEQYENITSIHLGDHEIWQPDIYLFYSASSNSIDQDRNTNVVVNSEGEVFWYPPASYQLPCLTNYKYFPFDEHNCQFEFGSWTHDGDSIFLNTFDDFKLKPEDVTSAEWKIVSVFYKTNTYYMGEKYPYNAINMTLIVKRVSSIYKLTTVIPIVSSGFLTLSGFWMELWTTPRYVVGIANFVMMAFHLLNLGSTLPAGNTLPLLAQFSATALCLTVIFLVITVALDSTKRRRGSPPDLLLRFSRLIPEKFICATTFHSNANDEQGQGQERDSLKAAQDDWKLVCLVIDRIAFWVISLIYVIVTSLLLSVG